MTSQNTGRRTAATRGGRTGGQPDRGGERTGEQTGRVGVATNDQGGQGGGRGNEANRGVEEDTNFFTVIAQQLQGLLLSRLCSDVVAKSMTPSWGLNDPEKVYKITPHQYMIKTQEVYGSGIARPMVDEKAHFELKGQFLKELHDNTFNGSENGDFNEHIEKVLEIVGLFCIPEEVILFYKGLDVPTRQILDSKGTIPSMRAANAKKAIQDMAHHSQKWCNRTSTRTRSTDTSYGLAVIQAQLNNLGREIKKGEGKTFEEAYYTQFGAPFPQGARYRVAALGFYQQDNANPSYQEQRQTMEELLSKFMAEFAKRHDENSILIKEIQAAMDAVIRNQEA
nr:hypothetical protein [Tanacetum cinerariifolium]